MNTDAAAMIAKKKKTGAITCLVAAVLVLLSLFLPWLKSAKAKHSGGQISMSLLSIEMCGGGECEKESNFKLAREIKQANEMSEKKMGTTFPYFGIATLVISILGALALAGAGGLGLADKFIREPIAVTTIALVTLCLALVIGCIFVAVKPGDTEHGLVLGVSWPFFIFGIGIVGGIAGAQMLAKAYAPPEYDPYADPTAMS